KITNTKSSTLSGVILFGLDLECLKLCHKNKENILPINLKKKTPFLNLKSNSQKNN
ncbi:8922_t:CDS:1, partial [Diversispora eburnea]